MKVVFPTTPRCGRQLINRHEGSIWPGDDGSRCLTHAARIGFLCIPAGQGVTSRIALECGDLTLGRQAPCDLANPTIVRDCIMGLGLDVPGAVLRRPVVVINTTVDERSLGADIQNEGVLIGMAMIDRAIGAGAEVQGSALGIRQIGLD